MSVYDDVRHHHANLDGLWRAKIAKPAASINDPVYVTITAFDKKLRWGPCKWVTRGSALPQRGQDCLVSFDDTQKLPYVVAWWDGTTGTPPTEFVTSLPGSPIDGQECYYQASAADGIIWHLRYRSASASSYKWEFVGGPSLFGIDFGSYSITSTVYAWTANTPQLTVPLSGEYNIRHGLNVHFYLQGGANGICNSSIWDVTTNALLPNTPVVNVVSGGISGSGVGGSVMSMGLVTVVGGHVFRRVEKVSNQTASTDHRWMEFTPVRVG